MQNFNVQKLWYISNKLQKMNSPLCFNCTGNLNGKTELGFHFPVLYSHFAHSDTVKSVYEDKYHLFQFQVFYKMGMNGTGKLIKKCDLNKSLKLEEFTFEKFRHVHSFWV